ncbi:hypothetical protein [Mycoplasmoides pirum]|uniref:hypothetical protein n=1 Tax=Mycoplasmoides pirum TaxID=2122 RepID=UPI00047F696D|nr:hypothetical protein [Mycoplasmoides pirum]
MEFTNKKDKKFLKKIIANSIIRKGAYKNRKLIINFQISKINVGKIKNFNELLEHCGLANEYKENQCFVILSNKLDNTYNFKLTYAMIFCSINWKVLDIEIVEPNSKIKQNKEIEYVFIMPPNMIKYLDIKIGYFLRT